MSLIALDVSKKRIGRAKAISAQSVALPLKTYARALLHQDLKYLLQFFQEEKAEKVIIGLPLNMDDQEGQEAKKMRQFFQFLKEYLLKNNYSCELILWDERLTTFAAQDLVHSKKSDVDALAAKLILEDYISNLE